jgi:hypothetical protein
MMLRRRMAQLTLILLLHGHPGDFMWCSDLKRPSEEIVALLKKGVTVDDGMLIFQPTEAETEKIPIQGNSP